jgi:hypothetical protein
MAEMPMRFFSLNVKNSRPKPTEGIPQLELLQHGVAHQKGPQNFAQLTKLPAYALAVCVVD